jgi:hypothetical protein
VTIPLLADIQTALVILFAAVGCVGAVLSLLSLRRGDMPDPSDWSGK